jgi:Rho GDP-dissociation inhibitor
VDKLEQMLGSYGPGKDPYTKNFEPEVSPSGMLARTGSYQVRSRVIDDDGEVYAGSFLSTPSSMGFNPDDPDWEWSFKLAKEW